VRAATRGLAFPQLAFDHWQLVPGDPLDTRSENLARECMVKTRRRKGLSDDLVLSKYMDEDMLRELANTGLGIARHIR
jgi:U5 small nuclear ribonucleoprotein component